MEVMGTRACFLTEKNRVLKFLWISILGLTLTGGVAFGQQDVLFKYQGKPVTKKDLEVADQQKVSELESHFYEQMKDLVTELAVSHHLESLAKKLGKTKAEVESTVLAVTAPTEAEIKDWYEKNKDRIPPNFTFDKVKDEIKGLLAAEKTAKKKTELVAGLTKSGELSVSLKEPEALKVNIDTVGRPTLGDAKAPLTIVEFADYQCPHCQMAGVTLKKVMKKYPGKIRLIYMDFPVNPSGVSKFVAQGAFCAEKQGKFWEYHELAFAKQSTLTMKSPEELAKELQLKAEDFKTCLASPESKAKVEKDLAEGQRLGITGTPTIFLNGQKVHTHSDAELEGAIEKALSAK